MFGKLDEVGGFAQLDMQPILARLPSNETAE